MRQLGHDTNNIVCSIVQYVSCHASSTMSPDNMDMISCQYRSALARILSGDAFESDF